MLDNPKAVEAWLVDQGCKLNWCIFPEYFRLDLQWTDPNGLRHYMQCKPFMHRSRALFQAAHRFNNKRLDYEAQAANKHRETNPVWNYGGSHGVLSW